MILLNNEADESKLVKSLLVSLDILHQPELRAVYGPSTRTEILQYDLTPLLIFPPR